jgi:hypothetical protein
MNRLDVEQAIRRLEVLETALRVYSAGRTKTVEIGPERALLLARDLKAITEEMRAMLDDFYG